MSTKDTKLVQSLYAEQISHNNLAGSNISTVSVPAELNPGCQETLCDNVPVEILSYNRLVIPPGEGQRHNSE